MALYEVPYGVLRYAWRALGNTTAADEAERLFHEIRARRLGTPANEADCSNVDDHTPVAQDLNAKTA